MLRSRVSERIMEELTPTEKVCLMWVAGVEQTNF
jgi:hypothetical protein